MNNVEKEVSANRNRCRQTLYSASGATSGSVSGTTSGAGSNSGSPSSNSKLKMRNTSSTVSSSKSVFSISISRGAFNTAFAVSVPVALLAWMTHQSISSLNSSR